ncbi:GAF domain-containing protein [Fulvivirga sedimenti]|uniref:GAF domain-containing protein n=1 Tax=Fulvivirga sedimenti TaxID=2879465 RepID=A0A9X1HV58_9BACT|nr:GAF domain-containing protein [Fulvivirga sedimenti]MCA6078251.1 GAF domain-containing protein [Fulvivirga sedimenti]
MAEDLILTKTEKSERYEELLPQIKALVGDEDNMIANLANIAAALKEAMGFFWVGFYIVDTSKNQLVLGPFQGPVACTRIGFGKGVCGKAWETQETIIVDDVDEFPGHIACSSLSKSEIVVPHLSGDKVDLILDVDSDRIGSFDNTDAHYLQVILALI